MSVILTAHLNDIMFQPFFKWCTISSVIQRRCFEDAGRTFEVKSSNSFQQWIWNWVWSFMARNWTFMPHHELMIRSCNYYFDSLRQPLCNVLMPLHSGRCRCILCYLLSPLVFQQYLRQELSSFPLNVTSLYRTISIIETILFLYHQVICRKIHSVWILFSHTYCRTTWQLW